MLTAVVLIIKFGKHANNMLMAITIPDAATRTHVHDDILLQERASAYSIVLGRHKAVIEYARRIIPSPHSTVHAAAARKRIWCKRNVS